MIVELHLLQNFPPSCLNRDDTNAPKDCEFGGYRRARISSQCIKRSIRKAFSALDLLEEDHRATRTKILIDRELVPALDKAGRDPEQARAVCEAAIGALGLGVKEGKSSVLLFLGRQEMDGLAKQIQTHWDELTKIAGTTDDESDDKKSKKSKKPSVPAALRESLLGVLDGGKAADIALFGRMIAEAPIKNVDAACQVAHAISVNRISMEMDYFTAVDDLQSDAEPGAGMIGTIEFNSACFYRYANIDLNQLAKNLQEDREVATRAVEAFCRASIDAIPTGKQTSMAAQNPPSLILAVVRDHGRWSLANAFAKPVYASNGGGLVEQAMAALDDYWGRLTGVYGDKGLRAIGLCTLESSQMPNLEAKRLASVEALIERVMAAVKEGGAS